MKNSVLENCFPAVEYYTKLLFDYDRDEEDHRLAAANSCIDSLHDIFVEATRVAKIRDSFGDTHIDAFPFGLGVIERSERCDHNFTLGTSIYGYYIETSIICPEMVRFMTDEFWQHISILQSLGKAELQDHGYSSGFASSASSRVLMKNNKSLTFSMLRDYVISFCEEGTCHSLGSIKITIPLESKPDELFKIFSSVLSHLHRATYLLWRYNYQQNKVKVKRLERELSKDK